MIDVVNLCDLFLSYKVSTNLNLSSNLGDFIYVQLYPILFGAPNKYTKIRM